MRRFFAIFKDTRGGTAVEYGLILAMIFLAMVGAVGAFASAATDMWSYISNEVMGA